MRFLIFVLLGHIYIKQGTVLDVFFVYCEIHIDSKKTTKQNKKPPNK